MLSFFRSLFGKNGAKDDASPKAPNDSTVSKDSKTPSSAAATAPGDAPAKRRRGRRGGAGHAGELPPQPTAGGTPAGAERRAPRQKAGDAAPRPRKPPAPQQGAAPASQQDGVPATSNQGDASASRPRRPRGEHADRGSGRGGRTGGRRFDRRAPAPTDAPLTPEEIAEAEALHAETSMEWSPTPPETGWDPASFVVEPAEGKTRFQDFDIPPSVLHGVADLGFQYCTPIQAEALGLAMAGKNVAGKAQTGTGKTAAFLITVFKRLLEHPETRPTQPGRPAALILGPTRELVIQIAKDAAALGKYTGVRCAAVYGGMDYARQEDDIRSKPVDIVAATPGRLLDFRRSRIIDLSAVATLVIDEADRMLDMGFIPDVSRIVRELPKEDRRQTMLFSATLNDDIMRLAARWMPDPVQVSVEIESVAAETIHQIVYPIRSEEKLTVLYNFLQREKDQRVLVFCNRKVECERLHADLVDYGIAAEVLSGDVAQARRLRVLEDFRAGKLKVVVATDVAGRGIHVEDIAYVVNYDFPYEADDYVHRIGRTGRAGHEGTAISFACEDESFIIPDIEKLIGEELPCEMPPDELFAPLPEVEHKSRRALRGARGSGGGRPGGGFHRGGPRKGPPRKGGLRRR